MVFVHYQLTSGQVASHLRDQSLDLQDQIFKKEDKIGMLFTASSKCWLDSVGSGVE